MLHVAALAAQIARTELDDVLAVEAYLARRRLDQPQH
jgi:hypothetical protein